MACQRCPYTSQYELLWEQPGDPRVLCVLLCCCAGPELQVRCGDEVLLAEIFKTVTEVRARAEALRSANF